MNAELPMKFETEHHRQLRNAVWYALPNWCRYIIAVDGVDGAGKSTLARYLAWQLGMPAIETDTFLKDEKDSLAHREQELLHVIQSRLAFNRPVIVEGIFILRTLATLDIQPDFIVFVEQEGHDGGHSFEREFCTYQREHRSRERAHFIFRWTEEYEQKE